MSPVIVGGWLGGQLDAGDGGSAVKDAERRFDGDADRRFAVGERSAAVRCSRMQVRRGS
jgi:hypothetical protein